MLLDGPYEVISAPATEPSKSALRYLALFLYKLKEEGEGERAGGCDSA